MGIGSILGKVAGPIIGGIIGADASGDAADASAAGAMAGVAENRRQFDTVLNLQAPAINTGNAARSMLASIMGLDVPGSSYTAGGTTAQPQQSGGPSNFLRARLPGYVPQQSSQPASGTTGGLTFTNPASKPMSAEEIQQRLESFPGYKFAVQQATQAAQAMGSATGSLGGNVISALGDRVGGGIALPTFNSYLDRLEGLSGGGSNAGNTASVAAMNTGNSVANGLNNAGDARASGILGQAGAQIGTIGGILGAIGQNQGNQLPKSGFTPYTGNPYGNSIPYARP